jgi:hypothetical protein
MLAAITSILLAFTLSPAQRGDIVRQASVHLTFAGAGEAAIAAPDRWAGKRLDAASLDPDPGVLPGALPLPEPARVSRPALTVAAAAFSGAASIDLPTARGPPAPVA